MTANTVETDVMEGIRIEEHRTYWVDEKPKGWTWQEWEETKAAAKRGETLHDGIEALCSPMTVIESEIQNVVWEKP